MKKMNVIIVHGAYGHPEENWFGWLKRELNALNIECYVPQLPTPEEQNLAMWLEVFAQTCSHLIHPGTVMIGHSLGAAFILRWLELHPSSLSSVVLVGGFLGVVGDEKFDSINSSFFKTPFNFQQIKRRAQEFICYYGNNDPYVTREEFDFITHHLKAKKIIISNAGHFNTASGYSQFPHLLNQLSS